MSLDEKIRDARRRPHNLHQTANKGTGQSLAVIESELEHMASLSKTIQRRFGRKEDAPWYVSLWTMITDMIFPPEKIQDIQQLYRRQEKGFTIVCTELKKILDGAESRRKRFEDIYQDVLEQKRECEEKHAAIQQELGTEHEEYNNTKGGGRKDCNQSSRRIKHLAYQAEQMHMILEGVEKRRAYIHDVCEHQIDIMQTYHRLYYQAVGFLQDARIFREANESFSMSSEVAESLFGTLDAFMANIMQLRQGYHDSKQTSADYVCELLQEAESAEQFQKLEEGNTNENRLMCDAFR